MKRQLFLLYALVCYFTFFVTMLYLIGFVGNLWVPKSVDSGGEAHFIWALTVNLFLIALFGLQHSVMARQWFKDWWTKFVPMPIERATYVLFASVILLLTFCFWQPIDGVIWDLRGTFFAPIAWTLFGLGWVILFTGSFMIDHFELFGVRQAVCYFKSETLDSPTFKTPCLYKYIRHPIYLGLLLGLWFTPMMTVSHLVLALGYTAYIFIGVIFEERDLIRLFGDKYREYKNNVPMVIPFLGKNKQ